ncbi:hypothetical protein [Roseomonas marmotae]|uniref:DUF2169 domain-containing protein n=1 Tax=Roseomonas marmotae TaxID=2768161 RepID=A0ABS3KE58_9PROT|nr:hypothetical protein [Roseomonas marmotae]MBO1075757.1 hypothetical protein [Roseomonas marmotae]QTI80486.1 hypothetical protein IAI58_07025 [Roseomonas marmotae]
MAQVMPCSPATATPVKDWFDTGDKPVGIFRFRGGLAVPTTRALVHESPEGRRFIPARPVGLVAPPWQADAWYAWQADLAWSVRRALRGQTPRRLMLFLTRLDMRGHGAILHPVFDRPPTREDEERVFAVELEVWADFIGCCQLRTQMLLAPPAARLTLPPGTVAYRRPN